MCTSILSQSNGQIKYYLKIYTLGRKEGRKEGNVLFNDTLNTFYLWLYGRKERKEMFYVTTHSTHFIYGYMEGRKGRKCFI